MSQAQESEAEPEAVLGGHDAGLLPLMAAASGTRAHQLTGCPGLWDVYGQQRLMGAPELPSVGFPATIPIPPTEQRKNSS